MVIFSFCHFPVLPKNDTIRYYNDKWSFLSTSGRKLHIFAAVLRGICKVFLRKIRRRNRLIHVLENGQEPGTRKGNGNGKSPPANAVHWPEGLLLKGAGAPYGIFMDQTGYTLFSLSAFFGSTPVCWASRYSKKSFATAGNNA